MSVFPLPAYSLVGVVHAPKPPPVPGAQHLIAAAGAGALVGAGAAWQAGLDAPVHALLLAAAAVLVIGVALVLLVRSERSRTWLAQSKVVT